MVQVLVQVAPKVYEEGPDLESLRAIVQTFAEQYNIDFQANKVSSRRAKEQQTNIGTVHLLCNGLCFGAYGIIMLRFDVSHAFPAVEANQKTITFCPLIADGSGAVRRCAQAPY